MALLVSSAGTHLKLDSNLSTVPSQSYIHKSENYCMRDLEIDIGYIGEMVIALCADQDFEYAFHAAPSKGQMLVNMSSTHGIITTGRYDLSTPARQLILLAMNNHLNAIRQLNRPVNIPVDSSALSPN